jgi:hypothetical protein
VDGRGAAILPPSTDAWIVREDEERHRIAREQELRVRNAPAANQGAADTPETVWVSSHRGPGRTAPGEIKSEAAAPVNVQIVSAIRQNHDAIEVLARSHLLLIEERLKALRDARQNIDEAQAAIAGYEDLKSRVEDFLQRFEHYAPGADSDAALAKSSITFAEGLRRIWTERHVQICDVGLFGIGAGICMLGGPLATIVAGTIVKGDTVVEAIKAAVELAKRDR